MLVNQEKFIFLLSKKKYLFKIIKRLIISIKNSEIVTISKYLKKLRYLLITTTGIDQIQKKQVKTPKKILSKIFVTIKKSKKTIYNHV